MTEKDARRRGLPGPGINYGRLKLTDLLLEVRRRPAPGSVPERARTIGSGFTTGTPRTSRCVAQRKALSRRILTVPGL